MAQFLIQRLRFDMAAGDPSDHFDKIVRLLIAPALPQPLCRLALDAARQRLWLAELGAGASAMSLALRSRLS
jgi:hypothetical protein